MQNLAHDRLWRFSDKEPPAARPSGGVRFLAYRVDCRNW